MANNCFDTLDELIKRCENCPVCVGHREADIVATSEQIIYADELFIGERNIQFKMYSKPHYPLLDYMMAVINRKTGRITYNTYGNFDIALPIIIRDSIIKPIDISIYFRCSCNNATLNIGDIGLDFDKNIAVGPFSIDSESIAIRYDDKVCSIFYAYFENKMTIEDWIDEYPIYDDSIRSSITLPIIEIDFRDKVKALETLQTLIMLA